MVHFIWQPLAGLHTAMQYNAQTELTNTINKNR